MLEKVNGIDLTSISHLDAVRALSRPCIVAQLTICKEGDISLLSKQETISVTLRKHDDNQLGIKLIQKKHLKGIFILEIIPGGIADWDGRLQSDDLILQVNGRDILEASQEEAVHIIKASPSQVTLLVSRIPSSTFPTSSPLRSSPVWCDDVSINSDDDAHLNFFDLQFMPRDKVIQVQKMEGEYLGLSIGGGLGSCSGKHNTPIYITNLWTGGCLAKTNQLMKGDVLLSVNRTNLLDTSFDFAAKVLKSASKKCYVNVHILQGSETSDGNGNFTPSWKFWLALPQFCYHPQNVVWKKSKQTDGLGFSLTGGFKITVGPMPVVVKSVQENSYAHKHTGLKSGDLVLSVNGISLDGATQGDAVRLMTSTDRDQLDLTIVSWPGSSV